MAYLNNDGVLYFWQKIKSYITNAIPTKVSDLTNDSGYLTEHQDISGKVDKIAGKGLSTNDYTTADKNKLTNIEAGAEVNVIESIEVNGVEQSITNKTVDISVPTKTSDITNDSGFITSSDVPEGAAASTTVPLMNGTAAVGTETTFARGDHIHPSDTSKVDKVVGKGLSTNDYTTADKEKLSGIEAGAEVNVIEAVKVNNTAISVSDKSVNVVVPTKVSDLNNDSGFITSSSLPVATTTSPKMNGTAAVGTETKWAKGDHVHPSDTSKVSTTRKINGHSLASDVTITKSDVSLGNVTNDAQVKGLSTGTTDDHVVIWGADGYTVKDSGFTIGKSVPSNALFTDTTYNDATSSVHGLMSASDKSKLDAFSSASNYALKTDITSMYKHKGSVATVSDLPESGNTAGDVYNVTSSGMNYVWTGSEWDALGEIFTITNITNAEIDAIVAQ